MSEGTRELGPAASPRLAALTEGWTAAALGAGVLLLAWVVRMLLAQRIEAPWIMGDELRYAELGKGFAETGHFLFRGSPTDLWTLYGVVIAPAWFAHSMSTAYDLVKAINVTAMTLSAVPLFFWMRRVAPVVHAVVATALFLLIPSFVYTGLIMTESLFLPVFVLFAFVLALTLERPTVVRQLVTLALAGLATGVRFQGVLLFLVVVTAMLLKAWFDLRAAGRPVRLRSALEALRPFAATAIALAALVVLYVAYKAAQGQSLASGLQAYQTVAQTNYTFRSAALWVVYHFAEITLATAIVPACALIVLAAVAGGARSGLTSAQRAFIAVAIAGTIWFVVVAGTFASKFSFRVEERNMFYVQPLLLGALLLWIAFGCPRPRTATLVAAVVPVALLVTLPFESLFNVSAISDTFGLVPFMRLATSPLHGVPEVRVLIMLGASAAVLFFALVPARWALIALPLGVGLFFVLSTKSVSGAAHAQSVATRHAYGIGADPSWVDHALPSGKKAAFVYSSPMDGDPHALWQTEFWNRDVDTVYNWDAPAAGFPGTNLNVDTATGHVHPEGGGRVVEPYAVTDARLNLAGPVVASSGQLVLRRLDRPTRLAQAQDGIASDGWMGSDAGLTSFSAPRSHTLALELSRAELGPNAPPARATLTAGPLRYVSGSVPGLARTAFARTVTVTSGRPVVVRVPVPKAPYRIQLHVAPTFDASQLGGGDTRQLGAVVRVVP